MLLIWIFVHSFGWGFTGVALASTLQFVARFSIACYLINSKKGLKDEQGV
jgi:Na+-driven multidrug efflux pump